MGAAQRREKRTKIFQCATLVLGEASHRIHLLDASPSGARAHAQNPVPIGAQVSVECCDLARHARVQWSEGKKFGLLFDRPISAEQVLTLAGALRRAA